MKRGLVFPSYFFFFLLLSLLSWLLYASDLMATITTSRVNWSYNYLSADRVTYDRQKQIMTIVGNVYIDGDNSYSLYADKVVFDNKHNKIMAEGNVILKDKSGNISFVDSVELSGDLMQGKVQTLKVLLSDKSKLIADSAQRVGGEKSIMTNVIYSPCSLCYKSGDKEKKRPTWSIAAEKVVWDHNNQSVSYKGVSFRLLDNQILYLPFFAHPDPSVKRKKGILFPNFGYDEISMGAYVGIPYYYYFSPSHDVEITPYFGSKAQLLILHYRKHFGKGVLEIKTSGAYTPDDTNVDDSISTHRYRGHIDAKFNYDINDNWRMGAKVERASDRSYPLKFSPIGMKNKYQLDSEVFFEGFFDRSYIYINSLLFQGLRIDDKQNMIPIVLPRVNYYYHSPKDRYGGNLLARVNVLGLSRAKGSTYRRLHLESSYILSKVASIGLKTDFMLKGLVDLYSISDFQYDPNDLAKDYNGFRGRFHPSVYVKTSYPLYKSFNQSILVVEPVLAMKLSANARQSEKIPNEDNRIFELDGSNIMQENRQNGLDLLDVGSRLDYGVSVILRGGESGYSGDLFVGQSYNLVALDDLFFGSGLKNNLSDIVIRASFEPLDIVRFRYRGRIDSKKFQAKRTELVAHLGRPILNAEIQYNSIDKIGALQGENPEQQLSLAFSTRISDHVGVRVFTKRNIGDNTEPLAHGFSVGYNDECSVLRVSLERQFYTDGELKPGYKASIIFNLKNLGKFKKHKYFEDDVL